MALNNDELIIYQFNKESSELERSDIKHRSDLIGLLKSSNLVYFIDINHHVAWLWQGSQVTTRMKFISAQTALGIRDQYDSTIKISTADEGNEPHTFIELLSQNKLEENMHF